MGSGTTSPPVAGGTNGALPAGGVPSLTVADPLPMAARIGSDDVPASIATVKR
ncbi:hypothetical protein [Micromonospora sp. HM5-17]|uniref:hypothetical protein n=1 Tax=Micromonospora sp. HM5-17 TaxID=2487710 RepID=UPI0013154B95|nr:hypothetical protein [Micromonospora sp. HM5-17]